MEAARQRCNTRTCRATLGDLADKRRRIESKRLFRASRRDVEAQRFVCFAFDGGGFERDGGARLERIIVAQAQEECHRIDRRPRLEVVRPAGNFRAPDAWLASWVSTMSSDAGSTRSKSDCARSRHSAPKAAWSSEAAGRQVSRAAASPPGSGYAARCPARVKSASVQTRISHPQIVPSVPYPVPSAAMPTTGSSRPCSAMTEAMCAWWCCTETGWSARVWRDASRRSGMHVAGDDLGLDLEE